MPEKLDMRVITLSNELTFKTHNFAALKDNGDGTCTLYLQGGVPPIVFTMKYEKACARLSQHFKIYQ